MKKGLSEHMVEMADQGLENIGKNTGCGKQFKKLAEEDRLWYR